MRGIGKLVQCKFNAELELHEPLKLSLKGLLYAFGLPYLLAQRTHYPTQRPEIPAGNLGDGCPRQPMGTVLLNQIHIQEVSSVRVDQVALQ